MNYLSPIVSSRFQISATIIKLIPIAIIAFVLGVVQFRMHEKKLKNKYQSTKGGNN